MLFSNIISFNTFGKELQLKIIKCDDLTDSPLCCQLSCIGESQNGCFKKIKHAKFSKKRTFLTPWYAHLSRIRKNRFSKNLPCFVFLKHPFWGSPLCPITDDAHFMKRKLNSWDYLNLSFNITIKLKCLDLHLFHIFLLGLINVTRAYVIHLVFFLGNSSCCSNFL